MKKHIPLTCYLFFSIILICYFFSIKIPNKNLKISCTSNYSSYVNDEVLKVSMNYRLSDGSGFLAINGGLYDNGLKISDVNIDQSFTYTNIGGDFIFTHNKGDVFETNGSNVNELKKHLYDFYLNNTSEPHHEVINTLGPGMWILLSEPMPYLICMK